MNTTIPLATYKRAERGEWKSLRRQLTGLRRIRTRLSTRKARLRDQRGGADV